jgi:hypothetical protein
MTGPLVIAIHQAHVSDLHAAAAKRRRLPSKSNGKRRQPARKGLLRPRRALAA